MKKYLKEIILAISFVVFSIVYINYIMKKDKEQLEVYNKEYIEVIKGQQLKAQISNIFDPEGFRINVYFAYLQLSNGKKISVSVEHNPGPKEDFREILAIGDSIVKESGSDSLFVIKTKNKQVIIYDFILKKRSK